MITALFMVATLLMTAMITPLALPFLRRLKFGQFVREDGPESHLQKAGTPTMGGLIFMAVIFIAGIVASFIQPAVLPILLVSIAFGIVGFIDDYIKVVKKRSLGFRAYQKLLAQLMITAGYCYYMLTVVEEGSSINVPFIQGASLNLGWLYVPFVIVFMLGTVNGVNLTDGIDGLATSVTIAVMAFFLVVNWMLSGEVGLIIAVTIGALFGFLIYNAHPASLFMGDTGSLALGGMVAAVALYLKFPLIILLVGFIYLAEVISVMIQVSYFKMTGGKRFFRMAPLHHHFELGGHKETKVVYAFTIVTVVLCVIAYIGVELFVG